MRDIDVTHIDREIEQLAGIAAANSLPALEAALARSRGRLCAPMQLAVLGKISSSKSTLVNAILGRRELMATGQKEVTWNVGWIKYGNPADDIIIYHKDGSEPRKCPRTQFDEIITGYYGKGTDNISYIEIHDDAEILRDINIIDTPGLDALRGKDSQNTLDFISKVRPDAVMMLFTHNVADNVLEVVRMFNAESSFNPFNALGIMAKIDVRWQESFPKTQSALEIGAKFAKSRMKKDTSLRTSLFNLYPVSALLFLAASTFSTDDLELMKQWRGDDAAAFAKSITTPASFLAADDDSGLRKMLIDKIGLYGIWLVSRELDNNPNVTFEEIRDIFMHESGASDLIGVVLNHFGSRATLIKLESIYQDLMQALNSDRAQYGQAAVDAPARRIHRIFAPLVLSHLQLEVLYAIYSGEIDAEENTDEIKALCGEKGNSAPAMLGMKPATPCSEMYRHIDERLKFWRSSIALEPDPEERRWMDVVVRSYAVLRENLRQAEYNLKTSKAFLEG